MQLLKPKTLTLSPRFPSLHIRQASEGEDWYSNPFIKITPFTHGTVPPRWRGVRDKSEFVIDSGCGRVSNDGVESTRPPCSLAPSPPPSPPHSLRNPSPSNEFTSSGRAGGHGMWAPLASVIPPPPSSTSHV